MRGGNQGAEKSSNPGELRVGMVSPGKKKGRMSNCRNGAH